MRWPGGCVVPSESTYEERTRIVAEYHAKWREESIAWATFEASLVDERMDIYTAEMLKSEGGVTLKLGGNLLGAPFDDHWTEVFIRAESFELSTRDRPITLEQLEALGDASWERLASK